MCLASCAGCWDEAAPDSGHSEGLHGASGGRGRCGRAHGGPEAGVTCWRASSTAPAQPEPPCGGSPAGQGCRHCQRWPCPCGTGTSPHAVLPGLKFALHSASASTLKKNSLQLHNAYCSCQNTMQRCLLQSKMSVFTDPCVSIAFGTSQETSNEHLLSLLLQVSSQGLLVTGVSSFGAQGTNAHALVRGRGNTAARAPSGGAVLLHKGRHWVTPDMQVGWNTCCCWQTSVLSMVCRAVCNRVQSACLLMLWQACINSIIARQDRKSKSKKWLFTQRQPKSVVQELQPAKQSMCSRACVTMMRLSCQTTTRVHLQLTKGCERKSAGRSHLGLGATADNGAAHRSCWQVRR